MFGYECGATDKLPSASGQVQSRGFQGGGIAEYDVSGVASHGHSCVRDTIMCITIGERPSISLKVTSREDT